LDESFTHSLIDEDEPANVNTQMVLAKEVVMEQATNTVISTEELKRHCLDSAEKRFSSHWFASTAKATIK
jgi:hypothetical protein